MVGYHLENTLSDFGTVSRGICGVDKNNKLTTVTERTAIARSGGVVYYIEGEEKHELDPKSYVSMNFWGFTPDYFKHSERIFKQFLDENRDNLKAEYFIPYIADKLILDNIASVKVLDCDAKWFGVTYKEDRPFTVEKINALIEAGEYPRKIWRFHRPVRFSRDPWPGGRRELPPLPLVLEGRHPEGILHRATHEPSKQVTP